MDAVVALVRSDAVESLSADDVGTLVAAAVVDGAGGGGAVTAIGAELASSRVLWRPRVRAVVVDTVRKAMRRAGGGE